MPTLLLSGMSEAERRAYIIADNRLAECAGWDDATLAAELAAIVSLDGNLDLALTGFDGGALERLLDEANHLPIVEQQLPDQVQAILASNRNGDGTPGSTESSLLARKLFDDHGVPMIATHACKGKVRYRYYVSRDLHHSGDARRAEGWRLPAREIEPLVRARIAALLRDPIELLAQVANDMPSPDEFNLLAERSKKAASGLTGQRAQALNRLRGLIGEVRLQVSIQLNPTELEKLLGIQIARVPTKVDVAGRLKRSGHVMRLIQRDGSAAAATVDRTLVKGIVQGRNWWRELQANTALTIEDLAQRRADGCLCCSNCSSRPPIPGNNQKHHRRHASRPCNGQAPHRARRGAGSLGTSVSSDTAIV